MLYTTYALSALFALKQQVLTLNSILLMEKKNDVLLGKIQGLTSFEDHHAYMQSRGAYTVLPVVGYRCASHPNKTH
ncbi:hypothetical protein BGX38DRAFT_1213080 [Terfezia claveryi]|nr:hypothetical protein BGX38DRAFT_1213080 [Terfezia claveryi]